MSKQKQKPTRKEQLNQKGKLAMPEGPIKVGKEPVQEDPRPEAVEEVKPVEDVKPEEPIAETPQPEESKPRDLRPVMSAGKLREIEGHERLHMRLRMPYAGTDLEVFREDYLVTAADAQRIEAGVKDAIRPLERCRIKPTDDYKAESGTYQVLIEIVTKSLLTPDPRNSRLNGWFKLNAQQVNQIGSGIFNVLRSYSRDRVTGWLG